MIIYIDDVFEESFIKYLPAVIISRAKHLARGYRAKKMNEYLLENYQVTIQDILKQIEFLVNKRGNQWTVSVDNNIYETKTNLKLISLIKLIDYGNVQVKGIHIVDSSLKYVMKNLKRIYRLYNVEREEIYGN